MNLAPNGKPSNLTPEQYKVVRTPEFKAWFGDWENSPETASKVVDENGEPLVVWHGTPTKASESNNKYVRSEGGDKPYPIFWTFEEKFIGITDSGWCGAGIYFTPDKSFAYEFGDRLIPCFVRMINPFYFKDDNSNSYGNIYRFLQSIQHLKGLSNRFKLNYKLPNPKEYTDYKGKKYTVIYDVEKIFDKKRNKDVYYIIKKYSDSELGTVELKSDDKNLGIAYLNDKQKNNEHTGFLSSIIADIGNSKFSDILKKNDYDGVIQLDVNSEYSDERGSVNILLPKYEIYNTSEIVVYSNKNIKLADGTNTTFDSSNPDIRFNEGGEVLLAPNGKPSNLTPEQYKLVRTPEFKAWFGDWEKAYETGNYDNVSKVIDEETKEPLVVNHTYETENAPNVFRKSLEVYIDGKYKRIFEGDDYYEELKSNIGNTIKIEDAKYDVASDYWEFWFTNKVFGGSNQPTYISCFLNIRNLHITENKGGGQGIFGNIKSDYDGISGLKIINADNQKGTDYYVVLFSNQIKLADGTNTTFDSSNPDIRYEAGGVVSKLEKNRLMDLSIKKYGESRVKKALELLYYWTKGDVFRYKISDFEPLSLFKPKVMPNKIYKGIRSEILGVRGWYNRDKDYTKSIKKSKEFIINKYNGKLSSWSKSPNVAVKFATSNGVLIMNNPTKNDIFIDLTLIPNDYKFSGFIKTNKLLAYGSNIFVPENEQEVLVILNESSLKKIKYHEVYFSSGTYLGDYKVDTLGLTKNPVRWHISPFKDGGHIFHHTLKEVYPNIFLLQMDSQSDLANTFARCQAFYEWDAFKGKKFNIKEFHDWYAKNHPDLKPYQEEFYGFNLPSDAINNCYKVNDERNEYDNFFLQIIEKIKQTTDRFYLIGVVYGDDRTLDHELAHAFFWEDENYKNDMTNLVNAIPNKDELLRILNEERGYGRAVLIDEAQAFLSAGLIINISKWENYRKPFIERFERQKNSYAKGGSPNRKPSELTPKEWKMYEKEQIKWADNLKKNLKDRKDGTIVYRGEPKEKYKNIKSYIWVTEYYEFAKLYGKVKSYILPNSLNILQAGLSTWDELCNEFDIDEVESMYEPTDEFIDYLKLKGYDGFQNEENILIFDIKKLKTNNKFQIGGNIEGGSVLLAPNGKPSNLTPEQYKLVRTPEFKRWFGDWENDPENASKVVDENGEPLVLNHSTKKYTKEDGSYEDYLDLDSWQEDSGNYYFSTPNSSVNPMFLSRKGQYALSDDVWQIKFFANIKNLFDTDNKNHLKKLQEYTIKTYSKYGDYNEMAEDLYGGGYETFEVDYKIGEKRNKWENSGSIPALISEMGYDAYINNDENVIVVFDRIKLKLADGTNTTFDSNNPDIRYESGGATEPKKVYVSIRVPKETGKVSEKEFYLYEVKSYNPKPFEELKNQKMLGIRGVSTSNWNINQWLVHRDCLIVMPFKEFIELNNEEQIQYDDANYLTKNGLEIFYRLYDHKVDLVVADPSVKTTLKKYDDYKYDDYEGILGNIFPKISLEFALESKVKAGSKSASFDTMRLLFDVYYSGAFKRWIAKQKPINTVSDFTDLAYEYLDSDDFNSNYYSWRIDKDSITKEDLYQPIERGILYSAGIYKNESEWVLKDKTLNIPTGSQLFFVIGGYENTKEKLMEMIKGYGLDKIYKINFINQKNLDRLQSKRFSDESNIYKEQFESSKKGVEKQLERLYLKSMNELVEDLSKKWIDELNNSSINGFHDDTSYDQKKIEELPEFVKIHDEVLSRFIEMYQAELPNFIKYKSKYLISQLLESFRNWIKDYRNEKELTYDPTISNFYNYLGVMQLLSPLNSILLDYDYNQISKKIKEQAGANLYRYYKEDEILLKKGGQL